MKYLNTCSVCSSKDIELLIGFEKVFLSKCKVCSFIFDIRIPTEKELYEYYKTYTYSGLKLLPDETLKSYNRLLDEFEKYRKEGNILDMGCGQGDFLIEAKKRNWNVYGTEFSESAVKLCKSRGIEMFQGDFTHTIFKDISFDIITSFEVIEHLNTPQKFMSIVHKKLRDEGLFYCTTPNFNALLRYFEREKFKMISYPEHISFYTKKSLTYLGEKYHFEASKILTTGIDIGRLSNIFKSTQKAKNTSREEIKIQNENIRNLAGRNNFMGLIKNSINLLLTIFGKGDTLKIYWIKRRLKNNVK